MDQPGKKGDSEQVKVVVRLRPPNDTELLHESIVETDLDRKEILVSRSGRRAEVHSLSVLEGEDLTPDKVPFTFDAVFDNSLSQKDIYEVAFRSLVSSVLEGFNGTIFAYGQTGTGKTFTMEGSLSQEHLFGVMPHAFKHIFDQVVLNPKRRYLVRASYFEIYQEEIRDLLRDKSSIAHKKCSIRESPTGVIVKGMSTYLCSSFEDVCDLLKRGSEQRTVGATNMNQHSSRSHATFQLTIETSDQSESDDGAIKVGKLNLVDLAGSERAWKTKAEGERLKEAAKINLSLSSLGNVISALVDNLQHIPYRDSKLTRILQDSLGGNSHTVMVATVSPSVFNYEETMNTLRYASRAKNIKNKPKLNENPRDAVLRHYQEEISRLKKLVEEKRLRTEAEGLGTGTKSCDLPSSLPIGPRSISACAPKSSTSLDYMDQSSRILKEHKEKLLTQLQFVSNEMATAESACSDLVSQISWLESKVLNSGSETLQDKMQSQRELIELKEKELKLREERQQQLRRKLEEKRMTNEEVEATLKSVEMEGTRLLKKVDKVERKIRQLSEQREQEVEKKAQEIKRMKDFITEATKELKLKKLIVDNFIPRKFRRDLDQRMRYDEDDGTYFVHSPSDFKDLDKNPNSISASRETSLQLPLFNESSSKISTNSKHSMLNTFFTNENLLLLAPSLAEWPAVPFVEDKSDPGLQTLFLSAMKDMENSVVINCDHTNSPNSPNSNKFPPCPSTGNDAYKYVAVGPNMLMRRVKSDKFVDFACVPSSIGLPEGSKVSNIKVPRQGRRFSQQQLMAFPLITVTPCGEIFFEMEN